MQAIKNYRDLEVWQQGRQLVKMIYDMTENFPQREQYGLSSQMRRAIISVPSNVAEGHSRSSTRDFIHFISMAIGSLAELDTQIILALDLGYINNQQSEAVFEKIILLQKKLHALRGALRDKAENANPQSLIPNPAYG